jgi:hypothetical protein
VAVLNAVPLSARLVRKSYKFPLPRRIEHGRFARLPARLPGAKCVRLKLWAKLEVPPWSPERNACVVYVCGSIEKFSGLGEKALQQGE